MNYVSNGFNTDRIKQIKANLYLYSRVTESSQEGLTSFCNNFEKCLLLLDVKYLGFNPSTFSSHKSGKKKEEKETL